MPEYKSKEMVREKLLKSLKESGSGFDLSWIYIINFLFKLIKMLDENYIEWENPFNSKVTKYNNNKFTLSFKDKYF